jgi:hypothetical protein
VRPWGLLSTLARRATLPLGGRKRHVRIADVEGALALRRLHVAKPRLHVRVGESEPITRNRSAVVKGQVEGRVPLEPVEALDMIVEHLEDFRADDHLQFGAL